MLDMETKGQQTNMVVLAAYASKVNKGMWKAFAAPYGITTQAKTCEEAKSKIEELVALYQEGLEKHGYPADLVFKDFSDSEDKRVLDMLWKEIIKDLKAETERSRSFNRFARQKTSGKIKIDNTVATYYQPIPA